MKYFYTFLLLSVLFISCRRNGTVNAEWFEIEIKSPQNIDCNQPEIVFITNRDAAYLLLGNDRGTYIALGLPKVNYPAGTRLQVKIRKPLASEEVVCLTLGPGWAQVMITELK